MVTELDDEQLYRKLADIRERREEYEKQPELQSHDCDDYKELRLRHFGNGKHYVYQCQVCGWQRGQSLKRDAALALNNGMEPELFDDSLETKRNEIRQNAFEKRQEMYSEERQIISRIHGWSLDDFESSYSKEQKRLQEANDKLSVLLEEFEKEFGEEKVISSLISQTVKRKKRLHSERQNRTDRFTSEKELKNWFMANLKNDFHIYSEVPGVHLAENVNVRIDFILYPKEHLISNGFVEEPFGVEVKYFKQEDGFTHKTSRGIWQTISYNDCLFDIKGKKFKTKFCLLFSNLSFPFESALIKNFGNEWENDQIEWKGMIHVANHARVGTLSINGNKDGLTGWGIMFAGGTYFTCSTSNAEMVFRLSNPDTINKMRIGNF